MRNKKLCDYYGFHYSINIHISIIGSYWLRGIALLLYLLPCGYEKGNLITLLAVMGAHGGHK